MLDSSDRTTQTEFENARDFIRQTVSRLDIAVNKTRVAVVSLAGGGISEIRLADYTDKGYLMNAIQVICDAITNNTA